MKKLYLVIASALAASLAGGAPAASGPSAREAEARGTIEMSVHAHSADDPNSPDLLFPTDRLSFDFTEGEDFSYSSRQCEGSAPFNDVGLDFRPDYPGVDDDDGTAPVRHHVEGTVTKVNGGRGTIEGTITTMLCVPDNGGQTESPHTIVTEFVAKYRRVSDNEVRIRGVFRLSPTRSTGTFEDIRGRGSIAGVLTCLAHERDPSQPTCEERGVFTDFVAARGDLSKGPGAIQPGLIGRFRDPTVEPV